MANKSKVGGKSGSKTQRPPQSQEKQPGRQTKMTPQPRTIRESYRGSGKLKGKVALITGGDSGIGRSVAVMFAREGALIAISFLDEVIDAEETKRLVEKEGSRCLLLKGDIGSKSFCNQAVAKTIKEFERLDVLVNNAAEQHPQRGLESITEEQ